MSHPHQAPPRDRRGRLLVVAADDAHAAALSDATGRTVVHVPNVLEVIGEMAIATARQPIEAVLLPSELFNGGAKSIIAALRRVDPAVRLIYLADEGNAVDVPAGFDSVITCESDARAMIDALTDHEAADSSEDMTPPAAAGLVEPSPETQPDEPQREQTQAADAQRDGSAPLGDTDLVEAALHRTDGVREVALTLIRQHTGWNDLALHELSDTLAGSLVAHRSERFGMLTSDQADAMQLSDWADWLGTWLALDASLRRHRHMAYHDELTDAWNRRYFNDFLAATMKQANRRRRPVTIMVFDIDDFKVYNDTFGHAAGDEILRETVRLLTSVIRKGDRVCRIGGDEFAVVFADLEGPREPGSHHPENVEQIAQRFQDQICRMRFPKLGAEAPATLSISAGLATYPWDGATPEALLEHADQLALQSKRRGKNVITLGPGAQQICRPSARSRCESEDDRA